MTILIQKLVMRILDVNKRIDNCKESRYRQNTTNYKFIKLALGQVF